ncbi:MAG TPA: four helix bundle protein [Oceanipulchritudo sp.]|nr:four helix bundle protein [Oceanipulchritudo sp.]
MESQVLPAHGGYKDLFSCQKAVIVYDLTVNFCNRFLRQGDRTIDQMIQAARSGKQNIVEGSMASGTSKEMELKLTGVARASLEELLEDYFDFLRVREYPAWDKDSAEAIYMRRLGRLSPSAREAVLKVARTRPPEVCANMAICHSP